MYSNSNQQSSPFIKARVLTVDIKRQVCKCSTDNGHTLQNVGWGYDLGQHKESGSNSHPTPNERVALVNVSGEWLIFMSLGSAQVLDGTIRSSLARGRGTSDFHERFNQSNGEDNLRREGSAPNEMVPGDKLTTGDRGSLFGLLKGGTFIAKASGMAQLVISKLDDLFRIVSRNYEMFSDSMVHYSVNLRGRPYTYLGYFNSQVSSRSDSPDYYEVLGDVSAGDVARENYLSDGLSLPAKDTAIKHQRIPAKDENGDVIGTRWVSTYYLNGTLEETSSSASGDVSLRLTHENGHWRVEVVSGAGTSSIDILPGRVLHTVGEDCTIEQTPSEIALTAPTVTVNASSEVNVTTGTASITATASATLSAPSVNVLSPALTIGSGGSGSVTCSISNANINATACIITGDGSSDVTMAGISLRNHHHTSGTPGNPTSSAIA